ncbi:nitrilase-related carbon-nitrogen hydrolase [Brachybacterium sp. p3-SID957]|uniref:nitrilase-related carbon-nitrogen hydrolase n=1 Tax=Brachybacterium sp. p3-SID957 TaxID=2916049 RepID=UPI00223B9470|nr:nitrilase-related carbon-nitrogen hydrolase [Brachybacterium sp. p3-SID957]MCT1777101.1 NTP transferase domain-containing protein [Brachybacterium sp. p3-SID957]
MASDDDHITGPTVAIVLAGGGSTRMGGVDKTRLPVAGVAALERVLRSAPADHLIVVGPEQDDAAGLHERHGARFVREEPPGSGPLAALARGVEEAQRLLAENAPSSADREQLRTAHERPVEEHAPAAAGARILLLGGDMPLLRTETLESLRDRDPSGTRVVALEADGRTQFLCAAWPLARLRAALDAVAGPGGGWADLSLRRLYADLGPDELVACPAVGMEGADMDTPEDLDQVRRSAGPRIAVAQVRISEDVEENLQSLRRAVAEATMRGARVLLLPEATLTPFGTDLREAAEQHHPRFEALVEQLAAQHDLVIVAGTFTPADGDRVHNTVIARGPGVRADYRKIHLFDAYGARESQTVAPGSELVTIEVDGTPLGIATCYDVRFPEQFTALARRGAQAILLPIAWAEGPAKSEQLRLLLRARALDSTCAILAADQAPDPHYRGRAPRGIGESAVISPLGQVRAELGREEGMLVVDLDLAEIAQARLALPVLEHGRAAAAALKEPPSPSA